MRSMLNQWVESIRQGIGRRTPGGDVRRVPRRHRIRAQLRRHSVAIISLLIALSSLGYNTWRNETSELHRNWRQASFELTREINELQQVVLYRRYFHPVETTSPGGVGDAETWILGWGRVASVRDLTSVLPEPLPAHGVHLHTTWAQHAQHLNAGDESAREAEEALLAALDDTRDSVLELIRNLR
nr:MULTISPECIES: hypothetical protein [unclassified Thioalkalivibrio]